MGRGSSQSKEVAGALKFKKDDLQPNQALGDRQKEADELNLGGLQLERAAGK